MADNLPLTSLMRPAARARYFRRRRAARAKKRFKAMYKKEKKYIDGSGTITPDTTVATGSAAASASVSMVPDIAVGSGASQRMGNKIYITSIQVKGVIISPNNEDWQTYNKMWRIALVCDKQNNNATSDPTVSEVWNTTSLQWMSLRNMDNAQRFRVIKDITRKTNPQDAYGSTSNYGANYFKVDWFLEFKTPLMIQFNGSTGARDDAVDSYLFLYVGIDQNTTHTTSGSQPRFEYRARIRYYD